MHKFVLKITKNNKKVYTFVTKHKKLLNNCLDSNVLKILNNNLVPLSLADKVCERNLVRASHGDSRFR